MTEVQKKAINLQKEIERACVRSGLNLTIYNGGIGFVDPTEKKVVMTWKPYYKATEKGKTECVS